MDDSKVHHPGGPTNVDRSGQMTGPEGAPTDQPEAPGEEQVPFDEFLIEEAGMETFPASDPPSWTPLGWGHHRAPHAPQPDAPAPVDDKKPA